MTPRDYQGECIDSVFNEWDSVHSTLAVLPTGCGKTVIAGGVVQRVLPQRTLFLCHRRELVFQARKTIHAMTGIEAEIEMGDLRAGNTLFSSPVVIAMVQSLNAKNRDGISRMRRFRPDEFGCLICDESHHGTSDSYTEVFNHFRQNPKLKILGITATPDRRDEEALGKVFETVAFDFEILDAIQSGWLVPVMQQMVTIDGLDFSHIRTTAGDLNGADLAEVMEQERNLQGVAGAVMDIVGARRTLVFTASVKQAEMLSNIFNRHRDGCSDWVCGFTPDDARAKKLQDFDSSHTQFMVNCGVLGEGYDSPGVEVIIQARPTKSRALYAQQCGRALRPLPGLVDNCANAEARRLAIAESSKPFALIVDFCGNSGRHKLMSVADILGGKVSEAVVEAVAEKAREAAVPVDIAAELAAQQEKERQEAENRRRMEEARKARLVAKVKFASKVVNPFDAFDLAPVVVRGWDAGKVLSEKQRQLLMRQGVDPDEHSYVENRQILNEFFRRWKGKLATAKQCATLKKYYKDLDVKNLSMQDASKYLDELANNNWRPIQKAVSV